jgi:hypothetical protein
MLGELPCGIAAVAPRWERARFLDPSFRLIVKLGHHLAAESR